MTADILAELEQLPASPRVSCKSRPSALAAEILGLPAGRTPPPSGRPPPLEPVSDSEVRVLCYLPTNLSTRGIANELYVSPNTVRTHIRRACAKLGTHHRTEAVARAGDPACSHPQQACADGPVKASSRL
jgi:DNA-binding NarL/FixJ family response regulator